MAKKRKDKPRPQARPRPRRSTFGVCAFLIGLVVFLAMAATETDEMVHPLELGRARADQAPDTTFQPPPERLQLSHVFVAFAFAMVVLTCAFLSWVKGERLWWSAAALALVLAATFLRFAIPILILGALAAIAVAVAHRIPHFPFRPQPR
jgi:hypothetical protein